MSIKMICCDMDGTLLNSKKEISELNKKYLMKASASGIIVVLATGRSAPGLREYYQELKLDSIGNNYICGINGAEIYSFKNKDYSFDSEMHQDDAKEIIKYTNKMMATRYVFTPHTYYLYESAFTRISRLIGCKIKGIPANYGLEGEMKDIIPVNDMSCDLLRPITKVVLVQPKLFVNMNMNKYAKHLGDKYNILKVGNHWIEFMPKDVNKGNGVKKIAELNNIKPDEILCFGDGENDISMFEYAKYAYAMKNALESVKKYAYDICDDNDHDGIAKTIKKLVFDGN